MYTYYIYVFYIYYYSYDPFHILPNSHITCHLQAHDNSLRTFLANIAQEHVYCKERPTSPFTSPNYFTVPFTKNYFNARFNHART